MNKKGFTLIELLAVIVILAIIALIATPIILGVVEKSKEGSVKSGTLGFIDTVEKQAVLDLLNKTSIVKTGQIDIKKLSMKNSETITSNYINIVQGNITSACVVIKQGDKYYKIKYEDEIANIEQKSNSLIECTSKDVVILYRMEGIMKDPNGNIFADKNVVMFSDTPTYITTDSAGRFKVEGIEPGEHEIYFVENKSIEELKEMSKEQIIANATFSKRLLVEKNEINKELILDGIDVTSVSISGKDNVTIGETITLIASVEPDNATDKSLKWTSSDESIAAVSYSDENSQTVVVSGISIGTVTIKATSSNGMEKTKEIEVKDILYTGIPKKDYTVGESVSYAGVKWKVIKDNGDNTTLIHSTNYLNSSYGTTTDFIPGNNAYDKLNTSFVDSKADLKTEIENGGVIIDPISNSYVRLPFKDELSESIKPSSEILYWTMTKAGDDTIYISTQNGETSYTKYTGYDGVPRMQGSATTTESVLKKIGYTRISSETVELAVSPSNYGTIVYQMTAEKKYSSIQNFASRAGSVRITTLSSGSYTNPHEYCSPSIGPVTGYTSTLNSKYYIYWPCHNDCNNNYYFITSSITSAVYLRPVITVKEK